MSSWFCFFSAKDSFLIFSISISFSPDSKIIKIISQELLQLYQRIPKNKNLFLNENFSLINFDIISKNLVENKKGNIYIIDWGDASIGDPAVEIARTFLFNNFSKSNRKIFYKNYFGTKIDQNLIKRVNLYIPILLTNSVAWHLTTLSEFYSKKLNPEISTEKTIHSFKKDTIKRITLFFKENKNISISEKDALKYIDEYLSIIKTIPK